MTDINTIEVAQKPEITSDTVSELEKSLRSIGIKDARAYTTNVYTLATDTELSQLVEIERLVHHSATQDTFTNTALETKRDWSFAIRVDFKPGVTDNAARVLKKDLELVGVDADVYTSTVHYVKGDLGESDEILRDMLERVSSNPQIHGIRLLQREEFKEKKGFENKIHPVALGDRPNFFWVDIGGMDEDELTLTGKKGTLNTDKKVNPKGERGGTLALGLDYMLAFQQYADSELNTCVEGRKKGEQTDTEVELIAQMWSEHCRHSLYNSAIPESEKGIFTQYIKNPTLKVLEKKPHLGVSIYKDNSGVFQFNDKWNVYVKNETHNSPSALDPFGGAITGIVGVNRDPAGTGLGGEVIGNFLFYFLGHPEDRRRYFKRRLVKKVADDRTITWESEQTDVHPDKVVGEWTLEELLLNPEQIFDGVVKGVEVGGNQMGIPINIGMCQHHDRYNGKPIVGVGSIGRSPIEINGVLAHKKHIDIGDRLYIAGGRAGRDGIHGATFSSEPLSENSPATAVQIGDAYTQRKLFEALLELRDNGYIKFVTDLGAGGVSCAALEMAELTNGLEIDLDNLLIKYKGMTATEIFMNESQERMAIAIDPKHKDEVEEVFRKHEVEFSDIGRFTDSGRAIVHANKEKVVDMDMKFIHEGFPDRSLKPAEYKLSKEKQEKAKRRLDFLIKTTREEANKKGDYIREEFFRMHKRPNLRSVAPFMDKMDSTVKGLEVQHCIQGKGRVSTKASCILVDMDSPEGLIQSYGHAERQVYTDAEKSGKNAFLRSIGNNIAMGGRLDYMAATDQALWQSSDEPEYQQMLIEANRGMSKVIEGCEIPVISGKDSMYNQAVIHDEEGNVVKRGVFPTILMTTFSKIDNVDDIVTIDAKEEGDLVYVVGATTKADMAGSEYYNMWLEQTGGEYNFGQASDEDISDVFDTFKRMNKARDLGILQSAKYVENGGLVTAIKDTSTAGELGIEFDIDAVHQEEDSWLNEMMYSETEGRFVVTVSPDKKEEFENLFVDKCSRIGVVKGDNFMIKRGKMVLLSERLETLYETYHQRKAA